MELMICIKRSINSKTKILVVTTKSKGIIQRIGMGASTVKRTTPNPCLVTSKKDSNLYTNFEFCEEKNHRFKIHILIYKAKQLMMTKTIPRKIYIF